MATRFIDGALRVGAEWGWISTGTFLGGVVADQPEMVALALAGVAGAYSNAVWFPLDTWRARALQGVASSLMALCLGGLGGVIADSWFEAGVWGFAFSGFLFAASGKEGLAIAGSFLKKR